MSKILFSIVLLLTFFQPISCKDYVILYDRETGFFSNFLSVLGLAYKYETYEISGFQVAFTNHGYYHDSTKNVNWWNNYFEPIVMPNPTNDPIQPYSSMESANSAYFTIKLDRLVANALIEDHIHVKPYIQNEVNDFVNKHFKQYVIGVHYRGTDKFWSKEARPISYDDVTKAIGNVIRSKLKNGIGSDYRIFVATDDQNFLNHMKNVFKNRIIFQNCIRSKDAKPIHYVFQGMHAAAGKTTSHGFQLGKEALIDALLLSRCNYLLRTDSNLSLCSTYFNPDLEVRLLNSW